jgi:Fe-S cluster assembly ATP-binding protein
LFSEFAKFDSPDARKIEIIRQTKGVFKELSLPEDWTQRDFNHGASGGERKKNELAQAKLKTPRVLLLDEPDSGLEQSSRSQVTDLIKSVCDDGGIVFLVTHDQLLQDSYPTKQIELSNGQTL